MLNIVQTHGLSRVLYAVDAILPPLIYESSYNPQQMRYD